MRQVGGDDLQPPRPRKRSSADLGRPTASDNSPTSFILGTEREIQAHVGQSSGSRDGIQTMSESRARDSEYGVQSMDEGELAASTVITEDEGALVSPRAGRPEGSRRRSTIRPGHNRRDDSLSGLSVVSGLPSEASSPRRGKEADSIYNAAGPVISHPLTPLSRASPVAYASISGSPRSLSVHSLQHPEDEDFETGSQAVMSSGDEESSDGAHAGESSFAGPGLQLVMPSLTLPSRRPFTERGKQLGKLKILFAGPSGSGKTSLIKSFVQTCNDIVHIDPPSVSNSGTRAKGKAREASTSTKKITEIVASTKPYPAWWSEMEESQILRRRKSSGEEVLERNVCFTDTPGYDAGSSMLEGMETILQHIESQMKVSITTSAMHDNDLLGVLGGSGGTQIDVVVYLLPPQPRPIDFEFLQQINKLTSVVPVLSKVDLLQDEDRIKSRAQILNQIRTADLPFLQFPPGTPPLFDVCSSPSKDLESMDASLLMTSDYIQPLHESDLPNLVDFLFEPDNVTFLKHVAAKKLVSWRKTPSVRSLALAPSPLRTNLFGPTIPPLSSSTLSAGRLGSAAGLQSPTSAALTYTSARLTDHKQREERMAQISLANWAESLRRNLAAERARYESIANTERERWLRERLEECVFDSTMMHDGRALANGKQRNQSSALCSYLTMSQSGPSADRRNAMDPLALMLWRRRALTALQIMGGVGILSAFAIWFARALEFDWDWLDTYGLSRWQGFFSGLQPRASSGIGLSLGRPAHDW